MADSQTNIKNIEELRAKYAFECAKTASEKQGKKPKEYKSYAKKLPMMIKSNGLGASLAFVLSKSKDKEGNKTSWGHLYDDINNWLREYKLFLLKPDYIQNPDSELVKAVIDLRSPEYRTVAVEVFAFLTWLRRFAEGLIEGEAEE